MHAKNKTATVAESAETKLEQMLKPLVCRGEAAQAAYLLKILWIIVNEWRLITIVRETALSVFDGDGRVLQTQHGRSTSSATCAVELMQSTIDIRAYQATIAAVLSALVEKQTENVSCLGYGYMKCM